MSIASYDDYHFDQACKALSNGKHVFVEKPLCLYRHEAEVLHALATNHKELRLSANLNLRTCPRFKAVRRAIASGEIGEVFFVEGDYLWGRAHKLTGGWRGDMEYYSIILGAAIHLIDLIMWVTDRRPVRVHGCGNRIAVESSKLEHNDFAVLLLEFDNGMTAKVMASGGCVHPHFHGVKVFGTNKTFVHEATGAVWIESVDPIAERQPVDEEYPGAHLKDEIIHSFIESIVGSIPEPIPSADEIFATMAVCFAAEAAMSEGCVVPVDYFV